MQAVAAGLTAATATHEYEQKGSTFVTRSQRGENGEWTSNDFVADGSVVTGNDDVRTSLTFSLRLSRNFLSLLLPLRVQNFKVASRHVSRCLSFRDGSTACNSVHFSTVAPHRTSNVCSCIWALLC